ncbi:sulfite exporter TauE/SafE protein [Toxoplasma gondii VAND]|uniref:Sulfite exporter TauE/SafE protein n=12 Tax=Toxoplasma gondii TaxID=5811 RepID=A0A086QIP5_TOXGO|nr:sulfite exporter TauE/SafE protein [Toxoplasma gondii VAND]
MEVWVRSVLSCCIFMAAMLAAAAGTGGGALYIPGYVVALNDVHKAVPLSKVTIFGACLVSVLFNLGRKQPSGNLLLISYELAAILEPFTLLGGVLGVLLNIVMTDIQIISCLVLVLSFTTYKTTRRGLLQYQTESRLLAERAAVLSREHHSLSTRDREEETSSLLAGEEPRASSAPACGENFLAVSSLAEMMETPQVLLDPLPEGCEADDLGAKGEALLPSSSAESAVILKERREILEAKHHPSWISLVYLIFDVAVNTLCLLAAGGPVAVVCGEAWQQALILFLISFHVFATALYARWLLKSKRRREQLGIQDEDVEHGGLGWVSPRTVVLYPFLSLLAGVAAGSLGIGGGLIKGPLLLEIGLNSLSAVTTANFMIFFTSSANALQYATLGRLNFVDSLNFFLVAAAAGAVGLMCVTRALKRTRRQSYLTLLLAFTTLLSMVCMLFSFGYHHFRSVATGKEKPLTIQDACQERHRLLFVHS